MNTLSESAVHAPTENDDVVAQTTETSDTAPSVTETLSELIATVDQQQRAFRDLHRQLKKLENDVIREHKRLSKVTKPKKKIVQNPVTVLKSMRRFMNKAAEPEHEQGGWTRHAMMRVIAAYIKQKDLQDADDRKNWKGDSTLEKLFSLEKGKLYSFMNINGLISRVVVKKST